MFTDHSQQTANMPKAPKEKLGTRNPNLSERVLPKRKPDRHKARNEKIPKSKTSRKSKPPKNTAERNARKDVTEMSIAGKKSWTGVSKGIQARKDQQAHFQAEIDAVAFEEEEEEEPREPRAKACYFIRKVWVKDPSRLIPKKFYPRSMHNKNGKVVIHTYLSEGWPFEILEILRDFATASKEVGQGEDFGKECMGKILEVTKARLEEGGEALVGTVEEGMTLDDAFKAVSRWSVETGVELE